MKASQKQLDRIRQWQLDNPDRVLASRKRSQQKNKDKNNARTKAWRLSNPEKAADAIKRWHKSHPDKAREATAKWRSANPEKSLAAAVKYRSENPEKARAYSARRYKDDPDYQRRYRAANPGRSAAQWARRHAAKIRATPIWADHEIMQLVYAEAAHRKMHVDHIVPLQGKMVCGLHVYWNTQLLSASENCKKSNRVEQVS